MFMSKSNDGCIRDWGGAIIWVWRPVYLDVIQHTGSSCKIITFLESIHCRLTQKCWNNYNFETEITAILYFFYSCGQSSTCTFSVKKPILHWLRTQIFHRFNACIHSQQLKFFILQNQLPNVTKSKHKPQQNKIQTAQDAKRNNKKKQACWILRGFEFEPYHSF
jgi:hypothetical protein